MLNALNEQRVLNRRLLKLLELTLIILREPTPALDVRADAVRGMRVCLLWGLLQLALLRLLNLSQFLNLFYKFGNVHSLCDV